MNVYCLMFSGKSLSDAAYEALYQCACDCVVKEKYERKVFHDDVRGVVHTDFDFAMMGTVGGIIFEGEVETEKGNTTVKYIVNLYDLENARRNLDFEWTPFEKFLEKMR